MDDLAQQATQLLGHPILLSSNDQVSKALFQELKLKSGSTSTNKRNLRSLQDQHPIVPIILEYRKIFKATSSYIDGMEKYKKSSDGRVHARWMQVHTGTGRLSSVSPVRLL
jgi:DNA polymerase-1